MKKRGFTLAEVMVALTLVGIVASLTIPTFVSNHRNKANAARLAATVNDVENTFTTMMATEAVDNMKDTNFGKNSTASNLAKYIKIGKQDYSLASFYPNNAPFKTISGSYKQPETSFIFQIKNGAVLVYKESDSSIAE